MANELKFRTTESEKQIPVDLVQVQPLTQYIMQARMHTHTHTVLEHLVKS